MVGSLRIHGSDGEVMAPIGGGEFIRGKRQNIVVVAPSKDDDVPLSVRRALVGMTISTMFSPEQLCGAAPPGSRTAYGSEVADALEKADKRSEARMLVEALRKSDPDSEYTFLIFEDGTYEYAESKK